MFFDDKIETITNSFNFITQLEENQTEYIFVKNKTFEKYIHLDKITAKNISFQNCIFKEHFQISKFFDSNLYLEFCSFNSSFSCSSENIISNFTIQDCTFENIYFYEGNFISCYWNIYRCKQLIIFKGYFKELVISSEKQKEVCIDKVLIEANGNILFKGGYDNKKQTIVKINEITISNYINDSIVAFQNIYLNKLFIHNYFCKNGIKLINIQPLFKKGWILKITNSNIGKSEVFNIDFCKIRHFQVRNSQFSQTQISNIKTPENLKKILFNEINSNKILEFIGLFIYNPKKRKFYTELKEKLAQIKTIYINDSVNFSKYHSLELLAYNKSLNWSNFTVKLIIILSYLTSNFGQSISKPIISLLIVQLVMFYLMIDYGFFKDTLVISFSNANFEGLKLGFEQFLFYLNPFRKFENHFSIDLKFIIIDLIMRIWSSYMIYNFIRASRRFIK